MWHVTLNHRNGKLRVDAVPAPAVQPGHVLIANRASVISAGTERATCALARQSLLQRARKHPRQVVDILRRIPEQGIRATARQAWEKLDRRTSLGYCSAGVVLECGADVQEFKPGDRVASNGPHADVVCVPQNLCARIPDNVPFDQAALTVLGAIALHGLRLAHVSLGEDVFVIGLGLVGQLAVALAVESGARVVATDPDESRCRHATGLGAQTAHPGVTAEDVLALTRGRGADAVLIAAATPADGPVMLAGEAVRKKGKVVIVGSVGMNVPRTVYYFKEAQLVVSCSYGAGRYDPLYEAGQDYPPAHARWTVQRNMQAVLDLAGGGRLPLASLISHRFGIEQAEAAYALIDSSRGLHQAIVLEYSNAGPEPPSPRLQLGATATHERCGVACLGVGNFARTVLLPALRRIPAARLETLCSARGATVRDVGEQFGFAAVTSSEQDVFANPRIRAVFIATRHGQHARQVIQAIQARKHVFVEKPLALTESELQEIESEFCAANRDAGILQVGFNRRFSPAARLARSRVAHLREPLAIAIRINAGTMPADHWIHDRCSGGGRIIGEACHAIDLATFLSGSVPIRVFAESVGGPDAPPVSDERCLLTLRHANGSLTGIAYLSGGDDALSKEQIEIFGGGQTVVIDDFRVLSLYRGGKRRRLWRGRQDKGHRAGVEAFFRTIQEGGPAPIAWEELRATTLASILAVRSLRTGQPLNVGAPDAQPLQARQPCVHS